MVEILADEGKLLFLILVLILLADLVVAFVTFSSCKRFVTNAVPVKAKVSRLEMVGNGQRAHVRLTNGMGAEVERSLMVMRGKFAEGDEIELLSDGQEAGKVKVNQFMSLWVIPAAALQGAVLMCAVLGITLYLGLARWPF